MTRTLGSRQYRLDAMPHAALTMTTTAKAAAWACIVVKYSLKTNSYDTLVVWSYGDFVFGPTFDTKIMSNKKFASVWDAIEDTDEAAENMKLRSALMMALPSGSRLRPKNGWVSR